MAIHFFSEEVQFNIQGKRNIKNWIKEVAKLEKKEIGTINFIFCSDDYLLKLNKEHLDHDTYTDIITFDYSDQTLSGDIFISIDRVKENALTFEKTFENELYRVIIHGVLHLLGYKDKTKVESAKMRDKENSCLRLLLNLS